jgi:hypothetical protein
LAALPLTHTFVAVALGEQVPQVWHTALEEAPEAVE